MTSTLELVVKAANDRLAQDIVALDVKELTPLADTFVIMTASSSRQLNAIVDAIVDEMKENDIAIKDVEGKQGGRWLLIDLYDTIVHVFEEEERAHYNLDNIWQDAQEIDIRQWLTD